MHTYWCGARSFTCNDSNLEICFQEWKLVEWTVEWETANRQHTKLKKKGTMIRFFSRLKSTYSMCIKQSSRLKYVFCWTFHSLLAKIFCWTLHELWEDDVLLSFPFVFFENSIELSGSTIPASSHFGKAHQQQYIIIIPPLRSLSVNLWISEPFTQRTRVFDKISWNPSFQVSRQALQPGWALPYTWLPSV